MNEYSDSGIYFIEITRFGDVLYEYDIILIMVLYMIITIVCWYRKFIGIATLGRMFSSGEAPSVRGSGSQLYFCIYVYIYVYIAVISKR